MMSPDAPWAIVTGGGTGGHVMPALAIMEGLVARGHPRATIHYAGAKRGIETRLVPPTRHPCVFDDVVGLQRSLRPRDLWNNVRMPFRLARASWGAWRRFGRQRPAVVVTVGGYASLATTLAAMARRVPIVVVSYDRHPGLASRLAARAAAASAVAFAGSPLPRAAVTGAPLRQEILAVNRTDAGRRAARDALGVDDARFLLAVVGGSLGSGVLNTAVAGYVAAHAERSDLAVRHVVGERFLADFSAQASPVREGRGGILYDVIGFEDQMPRVYAAADLVLVRAGASTVAELTAIGVPSIVVPWAGSAGDHQTENARLLAEAGAAVFLPESELTAERLDAEVERLRREPGALATMAAAARELGAAHRSDALPALIEQVASHRAPSTAEQPQP
jgi:UDP-N-acetylglucosamine--N-acetylmuramyl-(pentapeptide) pyrophosphoryl-undecaprenol N-acetylglucosamine transferase